MLPVVSLDLERTAVMWRFGNSPLSISIGKPDDCHTLPLLVPAKRSPNVCCETSIEVISSASAQAATDAFPLVRSPVIGDHAGEPNWLTPPDVVSQILQVPKYRLLVLCGSITSGGMNPIVSPEAVISVSAGTKEGAGVGIG